MPTDLTAEQIAALTLALRELHAAKNRYMRAIEEFRALIPDGLVVLHHREGAAGGLGTVYGAHWNHRGQLSQGVILDEPDMDLSPAIRSVIITAPHPTSEFLPRLKVPT